MNIPTDKIPVGESLAVDPAGRQGPGDAGESALETTTQEILAGALRRADVANHRELARSIAPLLAAAMRKEIGRETGAAEAPKAADSAATPPPAGLRARVVAWRNALLSSEVWRLRARSLTTGQPVADLQRELEQRPKLRSLQTVERATGRAIARWRAEGLSVELTTNLIAAIRAFVVREFGQEKVSGPQEESRILNFRSSRILVRASETLVVAAEFAGEPHPEDKARMDRALQGLLRNEEAEDRDLARIAVAPTQPPAARNLFGWTFAALLLAAGLAGFFMLYRHNEPWDKQLQDALASEREAQPALADWPLALSLDREGAVATLSGVAPPQANLNALARALETADPRYRLQMRVMRLETADTAAEREARLAGRVAALAEQARAAQTRLEDLQKWKDERQAEHDAPSAQLERLASNTVIRFGDEDDFLDADGARRDLQALAWALKAAGVGLRVIGYTDSHGPPAMNQRLSRIRAKAVIDALVAEGVDAEKLIAVGRAAEAPIAGERGDDRRRNRRVVFEMLSAGEQGP